MSAQIIRHNSWAYPNDASQNISFPISFSSAMYGVNASIWGTARDATDINASVIIENQSKSGFRFFISSGTDNKTVTYKPVYFAWGK